MTYSKSVESEQGGKVPKAESGTATNVRTCVGRTKKKKKKKKTEYRKLVVEVALAWARH